MRSKKLLVGMGVIVGSAALLLAFALPAYKDHARNRWKDNALLNVARLAKDAEWLADEIDRLTATPYEVNGSGEGWMSDSLILFGDGSWMVYDNICVKSDWRVGDIFVARSSNGLWYYSTYHFCIGACVLQAAGRPVDLAAFLKEYDVKEFTGQVTQRLQAALWR